MSTKLSEYEELKQAGLSDHNIKMLRNTGATHAAILYYAKQLNKPHKDEYPEDGGRGGLMRQF